MDVCILCLAIYLRNIPHRLPRYIKEPKGREPPLPKKFDWRDKKVIAEVRNQQTVSPVVFLPWFSSTAQKLLQQIRHGGQQRFWKGSALPQDFLEHWHRCGCLNIHEVMEHFMQSGVRLQSTRCKSCVFRNRFF